MLFSHLPHSHYTHPQLREVICQIRFPAILSIDAKEPAEFQEAIRRTFPRYLVKQERLPPKVTLTGGVPQVETPPAITNYHFVSADGKWKLNLTRGFISLSTLSYDGWMHFGQMLDLPLAQFIRLYQPAFLQRIGLRYMNVFSRRELDLEEMCWRELIATPYLGILSEEDVAEQQTAASSVAFDLGLDSSCRAKVRAGPGLIKQNAPGAAQDNEVKFILDMDLSMGGELAPMLAAGALETLHGHAVPLFEGAILPPLRRAME